MEYAETLVGEACKSLKLVDDVSVLDDIETVISIVSSSRAGSTVFKHALCLHPDVTCLAGEEEPYYKLCRNGFPWDRSDEFHTLRNEVLFNWLIATELEGTHNLHNRAILQTKGIEEPPFISSTKPRKASTLVIKTPQNVYRRGVLEEVFPGRTMKYIHLQRSCFPTVNGLLDGWHSEHFTARYIAEDHDWWKFDMPPNWERSMDNTTRDICLNQWNMANAFGLDRYPDAYKIHVEDFFQDTDRTMRWVWSLLGLRNQSSIQLNSLPHLMSTKPPSPGRWKKRRPELITKIEPSQYEPMMIALGYSMDSNTWV